MRKDKENGGKRGKKLEHVTDHGYLLEMANQQGIEGYLSFITSMDKQVYQCSECCLFRLGLSFTRLVHDSSISYQALLPSHFLNQACCRASRIRWDQYVG